MICSLISLKKADMFKAWSPRKTLLRFCMGQCTDEFRALWAIGKQDMNGDSKSKSSRTLKSLSCLFLLMSLSLPLIYHDLSHFSPPKHNLLSHHVET